MQNTKIDLLNIQHKCIVVIEKPKYMINNVFSWIKTAIETGKLKGNVTGQVFVSNDVEMSENTAADTTKTDITPNTIFELKKQLAKETKVRLDPFLRSNNNKQGVLVDPLPWCLDVPYYIIGDNYNEQNFSNDKTYTNYISNNNKFRDYANDRIVSCNVTQEIDGNWTANIVLNNTDDIYTLNNIYYFNGNFVNTNLGNYVLDQNNTCIIEPNDEVTILMSDWDGNFHCVFSGLVSGVTLQDDGLNKSVQLSCNDMLKKLTWHNYNTQPSLDLLESQGDIASVYKESYQHMALDELLEILLGDTYCDLYKSDKFLAKLANSYYIYNTYKDDQQQNKQAIEALCAIPDLIKKEIHKYIEPTYMVMPNTQESFIDTFTEEGITRKQVNTAYPVKTGSRGYKTTINFAELFAKHALNPYEEYISTSLYEEDTDIADNCDVAFEISGQEQPAWGWMIQKGWDFIFSHYEKNSDVIARIKGITQYEFFADTTGVIKYRAPNFTLPRINALSDISSDVETLYNAYIIKNYWVTEEKEKYFTNFNNSVNDNKIVTRVNIRAQWTDMEQTFPILGKYVEAPTWYTNKYGMRFMQSQMRIGLNDENACEAYGKLLLWKNNINYELCNATCVLNSNYTIGQPIYFERFLAVWYIGRVEHSFTSGGNCTTTLTLTYKRTPLCYKKDIQRYLTNQKEYGKLSDIEVEYIKNNLALLTWGKITITDSPAYDTKKINFASAVDSAARIQAWEKNFTDLDLVWQPIPADLYSLTLELQKQVDLTNEINQNNTKTENKIILKKSNGQDISYKDMLADPEFAKYYKTFKGIYVRQSSAVETVMDEIGMRTGPKAARAGKRTIKKAEPLVSTATQSLKTMYEGFANVTVAGSNYIAKKTNGIAKKISKFFSGE